MQEEKILVLLERLVEALEKSAEALSRSADALKTLGTLADESMTYVGKKALLLEVRKLKK